MSVGFRTTPRLVLPLFAVVLTLAACSDDATTGSGEVDTTPPAVSNATAIDEHHIEITFGEDLDRTSAENIDNYAIVEGDPLLSASGAPLASPGDPLPISALALKSDQRTVSLSTSNMDSVRYDVTISGVKDMSGNAIGTPIVSTFVGTTDADTTPPEIAYRSPGPSATRVPVGTSISVVFSELVDDTLIVFWESSGGAVYFSVEATDLAHYTFVPFDPLNLETTYTVTLSAVQDLFGNAMPGTTSWSFTTTGTPDRTPPTVVSSTPADLATNVATYSDIFITFSEPMDTAYSYEAVELSPYTDGYIEWQEGTTLRFHPYYPLAEDQQYAFTIFPNSLYDVSGNALAPVSIQFSTGNAIGRGGIAGTLTGDSQSDTAKDPTGAFVMALTPEWDVVGTDLAAGNNSYSIQHLPDGYYLLYAIMDSNGDGMLSDGDAFGLLGTNPRTGDYDEDVVTINGGNRVSGVNFGLFDASVISGMVAYWGAYTAEIHEIRIGLYHTNDPLSEPDYATSVYWYNSGDGYESFWFDSFDNGPSNGTYYIGAFLDADDNSAYDPGFDPAAFYGDPADAITVNNGSDFADIYMQLEDPLPGTAAPAVAWPATKTSKRGELLQRLSALAGRQPRAQKK